MFRNIYTYLFNAPKDFTTKEQEQTQQKHKTYANISETNMSYTLIENDNKNENDNENDNENENENERFNIVPYPTKKRKPRKKTFQRK